MADEKLHKFDTGVSGWTTVVKTYGNGKGTREQFQKSDPSALDPITQTLDDASAFASDTVHAQLGQIITAMNDAWRGENADQALSVLGDLQTDAQSVSTNVNTVSTYLKAFRKDWADIRTNAMQLGDNDTTGAHQLFDAFVKAENYTKDHWPNALYYHEPLNNSERNFTPNPGGVPGGAPGGAPGGPGNVPGGYPGVHPGNFPGNVPGHAPGNHPGNFPGTSPGGYPGTYPGGSPGSPGGYPGNYPGGAPGGYPGVGVDTSSHLAGIGGGPGAGIGGGPGAGIGGGPGAGIGGGPGAGIGGGPGAGPGGAPGAGLVAGGPGGGVAAGPGRGMMPGHGAGGDDEERDRSTWLTEDDDIWTGDDAPPGVIE